MSSHRRIRSQRMLRGLTQRVDEVEEAVQPVVNSCQDFVPLVEALLHEGL